MLIPIGLFLFVLFFYMQTFCATFNINDSGETIMVCDLLTISHSPGYPLHSLWGKLCCLLPLGKPMMRVTFASLVTGSMSVVVLYAIIKKVLQEVFLPANAPAPAAVKAGEAAVAEGAAETVPLEWLWEIPALFGALTFAFSYQHWFQVGGAKGGIYTLNTFLSVGMIFLLYKMRERGWFIKGFLAICFLYSLGLANHWSQVVETPAFLWLFFAGQKRVPFGSILKNFFTLRFIDFFEGLFKVLSAFGTLNIVRAVVLSFLGLSPYVYLSIRASQGPVVNWWNPDNFTRLLGTIMREGYLDLGDKRGLVTWVRNIKRFWFHAHNQFGDGFTYLLLLMACFGLYWLWKKNFHSAVGMALFGGGILGSVILFNNPLEGYQWTLDNFFTPVFLTFSFFAAMGVAWVCQWAANEWKNRMVMVAVGAFGVSLGIMPLILDYHINDQSHYVSSYDEGINMMKNTPENGVVVCNGDIDILPLWYLQFVEGKRPDLITFTMQLIPYDWYRNPLFTRYPQIAVPVGQDVRPETVVQDMINIHGKERPFYFTNIYTAPWMREKNACMPDGFLWRMTATKDADFPFTSARLNSLWSTFRLRDMEPPERGYWDEYTDVMKDSYGIGYDFTGYYAYMNKMYDLSLWCFKNALLYRQPQTLSRIYLMLGETYLAMGDFQDAINNYQECLRRETNPYAFARIGDCFRALNDYTDADTAYHTALSLNPNQKEAQDGLAALGKSQGQTGSIFIQQPH